MARENLVVRFRNLSVERHPILTPYRRPAMGKPNQEYDPAEQPS